MKAVAAIVGRPNVGKSTFFNRLTSSQDALVTDRSGVTRDRQYGISNHNGKSFTVIDTGGIGEGNDDSEKMATLIAEQSMLAAKEASILILLVDGHSGLTSVDETLVREFRKLNKSLFLAVNKLEGRTVYTETHEFYSLGLDAVWPISAKRGDGIKSLLDAITETFSEETEREENEPGIAVSVLGRPNVGKSTLINRMLGENRVLSSDQPGTTRDSIRIPFQQNGKNYVLIDTAGVRRRNKVHHGIEKLSILKSFQAIKLAKIVILVTDASEHITVQDSTLLGIIKDSGKSIIIAVNKWDELDNTSDKNRIRAQIERKFNFIDYAEFHFISALQGTNVDNIFKSVDRIHRSQSIRVSTSDMTDLLQKAVNAHPPKILRGRRIKLRYAHLGGHNPLRIIIHGNQTEGIPESYTKYLSKYFCKHLKLIGTPVLITYKQGNNPFKDRKNELTKRQINKKKRLMAHVKRH